MEPYCCVVCQEEITPKEYSYSMNLFNMALCRKHQDIQKQIRAKTEAEQKTNSIKSESKTKLETQNTCCVVCQEEITPKEYSYSANLFNMALCRKHQEIQKQIRAKAEIEQKTNSKTLESKITSNIESKKPEMHVQKVPNPEKIEDTLIQWLIQWANDKKIDFAAESKQIFLGSKLGRLTEDIIGNAKDEILVTNPYVDNCYLVTALQEARDRRVNVRIVSRRPEKNDIPKIECHAALRKKGVTIHYVNTIHAKIVIIDRKIAIISSMNLYGASAGGGVLEAGIVSFDSKVVDCASNYIFDLLEKTESPEITSFTRQWGKH